MTPAEMIRARAPEIRISGAPPRDAAEMARKPFEAVQSSERKCLQIAFRARNTRELL